MEYSHLQLSLLFLIQYSDALSSFREVPPPSLPIPKGGWGKRTESFETGAWLSPDEARNVAASLGLSEGDFDMAYCDVVFEGSGWRRLCTGRVKSGSSNGVERPRIEQLLSEVHPQACTQMLRGGGGDCSFPEIAAVAVSETSSWAHGFVAHLGLCPWAAPSLALCGAVRYEHSNCENFKELVVAVNAATDRLLRRWALSHRSETYVGKESGKFYDEGGAVYETPPADPSTSITFIVCPDLCRDDFESFHEMLIDLEEDALWDMDLPGTLMGMPLSSDVFRALISEEDQEICVGDVVTVAGFHPEWTFGELPPDAALHWEKRAPVPTVSLVLTQGITAAGTEVTQRIAEKNEATLSALGEAEASNLFRRNIFEYS